MRVIAALVLLVFLVACGQENINGNAIDTLLSEGQARAIATQSECTKTYPLREDVEGIHDPTGRTWRYQIHLDRDDCDPSCLVDEVSRNAELQWNCEGIQPDETPEEAVLAITENYLIAMDAFHDHDGRSIQINVPVVGDCQGCYEVEATYVIDSPNADDREDRITMLLTIDNWDVVEAKTSQGTITMTKEEAKGIAENTVCADLGPVTLDGFYNDDERSWWLDIDFSKPGCRPACIVSEGNRTGAVNWRCTGAIPTVPEKMCMEMKLSRAIRIGLRSECTSIGPLTELHACNEQTGTWWIDIDAEAPGCDPGCAVDIETASASIAWDCD
ncbi:MAG: hypothetical protein ABIC95_05745 [archaeon]